MANEYTLTLKSVNTLTSDTSKIDKVQVNVKDSVSAAVTGLVKGDFQLTSDIAIEGTDWDFTEVGSGDYEIDFADTKELANTSYLITKVSKTVGEVTSVSDRLFIDFAETFDENGQANFSYNVATAGDYKFIIDSADGTTLGTESSEYTFVNPPNATESSITPVLSKPYLVQVIPDGNGLDVSLQVTLKDASQNPLEGASEVALYADDVSA